MHLIANQELREACIETSFAQHTAQSFERFFEDELDENNSDPNLQARLKLVQETRERLLQELFETAERTLKPRQTRKIKFGRQTKPPQQKDLFVSSRIYRTKRNKKAETDPMQRYIVKSAPLFDDEQWRIISKTQKLLEYVEILEHPEASPQYNQAWIKLQIDNIARAITPTDHSN